MRCHVVISVAAKSRYTAMKDAPNLFKHKLVCRNSNDCLIVSYKRPKSIQRTRARSHRGPQVIVDPKLEAPHHPELATSFREFFERTFGHQRARDQLSGCHPSGSNARRHPGHSRSLKADATEGEGESSWTLFSGPSIVLDVA